MRILLPVCLFLLAASGVTAAEAPKPIPVEAATPQSPSSEEAVSPEADNLVVLLGEGLPEGALADEAWLWEVGNAAFGEQSHTHLPAEGISQHGVVLAEGIEMPWEGQMVANVWLDPDNPPRGIMIRLGLANGRETGVYWEGEEEVFTLDFDEQVWYQDFLPQYGQWTPLVMDMDDLAIEGEVVKAIAFVTFDGRVLWDQITFPKVKAKEEVPA